MSLTNLKPCTTGTPPRTLHGRHSVMASVVVAYVVMAYVVMADVVMAYIVMAYIVMASMDRHVA